MGKIDVNFEIDDGVPIPVNYRTPQIPIRQLKVGQSMVFPASRRPAVAAMASRLKRETDQEFTIRKVSEGECRVWRTK